MQKISVGCSPLIIWMKAAEMSKSADKFYPSGNAIPDIRTSCTKEEAAAKLIGWMKGHIRHAYPMDIDEDDITADHLIYMRSLVYPLQDHLAILRNAEWYRYENAVVDEASEDILAGYALSLIECDDLIRQVAVYLCDIDEELDKEFDQVGLSALRVDRRTTEQSGVLHITLRSLDQWAKKKYDITIIDSDSVSATSIVEIANAAGEGRKNQDDVPDSKGRVSKAVVDRIYTTFAITLEAYVATLPERYRKDGGGMVVKSVAEHLEALAMKANKKIGLHDDHQRGLYGQDYENLRKLIPKALEAKRQEILAG